MFNINTEHRRKANKIYNQCIIYSFIAAALIAPFLVPIKAKILTPPPPHTIQAAVAEALKNINNIA